MIFGFWSRLRAPLRVEVEAWDRHLRLCVERTAACWGAALKSGAAVDDIALERAQEVERRTRDRLRKLKQRAIKYGYRSVPK